MRHTCDNACTFHADSHCDLVRTLTQAVSYTHLDVYKRQVYERKMTGSFMKLRCDEVRPLDEKILLKNNIPGFLKMEKCYVKNEGQYWYDTVSYTHLDVYKRQGLRPEMQIPMGLLQLQ